VHTLLEPVDAEKHGARGGFFGWFNWGFERATNGYQSGVDAILERSLRFSLVYGALVIAMAALFLRLPTAFLPEEDQGILFTQIVLPAGATREQTLTVIEQVERYFLQEEADAVQQMIAVVGFSFAGSGQNMGLAFVCMKDWALRDRPELRVAAVAQRAMRAFSQIREAQVFAFVPPAAIELGTANGFDLHLQDLVGLGHEALMDARNALPRHGRTGPETRRRAP
jgi:multidrug efflux pump